MPPDDPTFLEPDLKTLRLATPELTPDLLAGYLAYQRSLVAELKRQIGPNGLARAHQAAQTACGLSAKELTRIGPVVADFAGKRWTAKQLAKKHDTLADRGQLTPPEQETLAKLAKELVRLNDLTALEQRYGKDILRILRANEEEVLALHERTTAAQREA